VRALFVVALFSGACAVATRPLHPDLASGSELEDLSIEPDLSEPLAVPDLRAALEDAAADLASADLGALPVSWGSPSTAPTDVSLGWNGNYATAFKVTLAAEDPSATIYYTTDGTTPSLSSPSGLTPLPAFAVNATTRVRWFAVNAVGMEAEHDDTYGIDAANQSRAGYITQDTSFEGQGPVLVVSPGQVVNAVTTFRIWYQSTGCTISAMANQFPCAAQLVYGVDREEQDCLFAGGAYNFAASGTQTKAFTVTAPSTPGVHDVEVAHIEELTCPNAVANNALQRPTRTRIGVLIVR
jgi:hypothetical protein